MTKPNLLLLHGAVGASSQFESLTPLLSNHFQVHLLDFEGHGITPARERPFRIEHFAENVTNFIAQTNLTRIDIFGYSMGGYVALYLARTQPGLVGRIATLGAKHVWNPEVAAREAARLDPDKIEQKAPQFAMVLAARHVALHWRIVLSRTREMMAVMGNHSPINFGDYSTIHQRTRICVGDQDSTVGIEESLTAFRALPNGEFEVLPDTSHPFEKVPLPRLAYSLSQFFV
ncbi:MAG TPA: alpha/beta fold hydrolase [Anaerolineales bacterium]|nr:alpha/beta fold hydrolase [Anaerolineales bacterium]